MMRFLVLSALACIVLAQQYNSAIHEACAADESRLCSSVNGTAAIHVCMNAHIDELSNECRVALTTVAQAAANTTTTMLPNPEQPIPIDQSGDDIVVTYGPTGINVTLEHGSGESAASNSTTTTKPGGVAHPPHNGKGPDAQMDADCDESSVSTWNIPLNYNMMVVLTVLVSSLCCCAAMCCARRRGGRRCERRVRAAGAAQTVPLGAVHDQNGRVLGYAVLVDEVGSAQPVQAV